MLYLLKSDRILGLRVLTLSSVVLSMACCFKMELFVGPDEARLQDHFECERNGQHDEGYSMTLAIRKQLSDNEIIAKLNEHIQKGWTSRPGTDRESLYYVARGNEAQLLLQLLKQTGRPKLEHAVSQLAKMPRTQLHKT